MKTKKITEYSSQELAEAYVFPVKLTAKQKEEAARQLLQARAKTQAELTESDKQTSRVLQLRFRLEDYLNGEAFDPALTFGHFLKEYVSILGKKRKVFADEISVDETLLSQFVNAHRLPPDYMAIRLELHSHNVIPAHYWYRLVEKQKEHEIKTNKTLRLKEMKFVHSRVA